MTLTKPTREITDMGVGVRAGGTLVIDAGAVTLTEGSHDIDTEAAAPTDELITINPGPIDDGGLVLLSATDDDRTIEVVSGVGNIILQAGGSFFLDDVGKSLFLRRDGLVFRDLITSGVSSGFTFIEEQILSAAPTLDFTGLDFDNFASFRINLVGIVTANETIHARFSQGAGFLEGANDYAWRVDGTSATFNSADPQIVVVNTHVPGPLPTNKGFSGVIELFPPFGNAGQFSGASLVGQMKKQDPNSGQTLSAGHLILNDLAIDGIRFIPNNFSFDDIRGQLWGLRK